MAETTCPECKASITGAHGCRVYCGDQCRARAAYKRHKESGTRAVVEQRKTERYRSDPEYRARIRGYQQARAKAAGATPMIPVSKSCAGCDAVFTGLPSKLYCSEPCKRRTQRARQGKSKPSPEFVINALVKHFDEAGKWVEEPVVVPVRGIVTVGIIPFCPECSAWLVPKREAMPEMDVRECGHCRLAARFNEEEVEAVIHEARLLDSITT